MACLWTVCGGMGVRRREIFSVERVGRGSWWRQVYQDHVLLHPGLHVGFCSAVLGYSFRWPASCSPFCFEGTVSLAVAHR